MTKRRNTSSKSKPVETTNEALMTVQLSDLDLGRASKQSKGKATTRAKKSKPEESGELLNQVSQLLEQNQALESSRNTALEQVDAISEKIEKLTANIGADCDCDETADKVNELDAKLASLQNALKKQAKRGDRMEAGFQLVEELGNKIESLSDQFRLSAMESEVAEDYTEQFINVGNKLTALYQIMEGQALDEKLVSSQIDKTAKLEEKVDILVNVVKESAIEAKKGGDTVKAVDSLAKQVKAIKDSVSKPQPELKKIAGAVADLNGMQTGIDALASLIQGQPAPVVEVPDYSKQFEEIAKGLNKDLSAQVDGLGKLVLQTAASNEAPEVDFTEQFQQLNKSLNENLAKQVNELGELIVHTSSSNEVAPVDFTEQFQQLNQSLNENLTQQVSELGEQLAAANNPSDAPEVDFTEQFQQLNQSLNENLAQQVSELGKQLAAANGPSEAPEVDFTEQFQQLNQSLNENLAQQVSELGEQLAAANSSSEAPEVDFTEQFQQLASALNENLDNKVNAIQSAIELSNEMKAESGDSAEQFIQLANKLENMEAAIENKSGSNESHDYSEKFDELAMQFANLHETVNNKWQESSEDQADGNQLLEKFEEFQMSMEERIQSLSSLENSPSDSLLEKLDTLQQQITEQSSVTVEGNDYSEQLSQLGSKVEWISQLMEERGESQPSGESADYSEQLEQLTSRLDETQSKIDLLVQSIGPLVEQLAQGGGSVQAAAVDASADSSPEIEESAWEKQKRELLAGYGTEPGADSDAIKGSSSVEGAEDRGEWLNEDDNEDEDSPQGDSAEVLALKAELEEKLRRAEIEISIERAKLSREQQKVEQQQQDVDQKIAKLQTASEDEADPESGGRWSRFLGKKNEG